MDLDQVLAAGVVVRVGGADAWSGVRQLLGAGVRIGLTQHTHARACRAIPRARPRAIRQAQR